MSERGCLACILLVIAAVTLFYWAGSQEPLVDAPTQEDMDRMLSNAKWFALTTFPELDETYAEHKVRVQWSDDVLKASRKLAKEEGITIVTEAGVWEKGDTAIGTYFECKDGTIVIFLDKILATSEGEVWSTYCHEMRHAYRGFCSQSMTRSQILGQDFKTNSTLEEEILTSQEMAEGIDRFLEDKKAVNDLKDEGYRKRCVEQLKRAQSNEESLIVEYSKRLERARRKAAGMSFVPGRLSLGTFCIQMLVCQYFVIIGV